MLEQNEPRGRIVRDLLKHVPRLLIGEDLYALSRRFGARLGTLLSSFFALDPKTRSARRPCRIGPHAALVLIASQNSSPTSTGLQARLGSHRARGALQPDRLNTKTRVFPPPE
jgi:hypothetical protein